MSDVTFATDLFSGYNLIAWVAEANGSAYELSTIVPNTTYVTQKNETTGNYESFDPDFPSFYNFTTYKGKGYYVMTSDTDPFNRSRIDDASYNTTLISGWSIFGWTNITTVNAETVANSIGANCQYVSQKNSTTGNYENFDPDFPSFYNFDVESGIGYYARVSEETIWVRNA